MTNDIAPPAPAGADSGARKRKTRLILLLALSAIAGWLAYRWWYGLSHVSTDNAQVEGHIVPVLPKVGGYVAEVAAIDNQPVKSGAMLVRIDERDYKARLAQAEADLEVAIASAGKEGATGQAGAQLAAARASAAAARAAVDQALANADRAQKDLERVRQLIEKKMVSPQQLDSAEAAARAAEAQVRSSREAANSAAQQVGAFSAALRGASAKVDYARAARDFAANQFADTRIPAPVSGIVSNKNVEPGQLVQAGQPLMSVVPLDDIWVAANLKETDVRNVRPGDAVDIEADAYPGMHFEGTVESLSPASGARYSLLPPDNATGNFTKVVQRIPVRIRLSKPNDPAHLLRPGMSCFVTISTR